MDHTQNELDELAFRFFKLFAQYESTLKERGYFRINGTRIIVDWDKFANTVAGCDYRETLDKLTGKASAYILTNPPMRQKADGRGKIIWENVDNKDQSIQALFGHICRVRNNLYHGAKFNGTWFDPERSDRLLQSGLAILEYYRPWLNDEHWRPTSEPNPASA